MWEVELQSVDWGENKGSQNSKRNRASHGCPEGRILREGEGSWGRGWSRTFTSPTPSEDAFLLLLSPVSQLSWGPKSRSGDSGCHAACPAFSINPPQTPVPRLPRPCVYVSVSMECYIWSDHGENSSL